MEKQIESEMELEVYMNVDGSKVSQCRWYLQTSGPNVGIVCILGSLYSPFINPVPSDFPFSVALDFPLLALWEIMSL